MAGDSASSSRDGTIVRAVTIVTTKAPQMVGLYLAVQEAAREDPRQQIVFLIALCILGVQGIENIAMMVISRVFGNGSGATSDRQP
jgi:hypothetical protein